jgi:ribosomal-protein-alanine N-acetyltransferase
VLIAKTNRMLIRPLSLDDLSALTSILSDPEVMKHSIRGVCDEGATREFIEWCLSCYESHGVGPWALVDKCSSDLIGFCGVGPEPVADAEEISLGYRLGRRYWGEGLASESSHAVLAYAFNEKAFDSIVTIIEPEHVASLRVAEKVGFSEYQNIDFHGREVRLYRMSRHQWKALNNQAFHTSGRQRRS